MISNCSRVKLERLTSNALLPSLPRLKIREDLSRLLDQDGNQRSKAKVSETDAAQVFDRRPTADYEEVLIGWQEKLFNRVFLQRRLFYLHSCAFSWNSMSMDKILETHELLESRNITTTFAR